MKLGNIKKSIRDMLGVKEKDGFVNISYWAYDRVARTNILKGILYAGEKYSKGKLVDVGCGIKPYESIFEKYVDSYYGIDHYASAGSSYGHLTKADLYCDCTDLKLDSEIFDTLLSTQVMEHVFDIKKYISECFRILKTGGVGIFTIPMAWKLHAEPYDYYRFTRWSLSMLFKEAGFDIVELKSLEGAFASLLQLKMVTLYLIEGKNFISMFINRLRYIFLFPILSWLALNFDRFFWNGQFCLNYLLVVKKTERTIHDATCESPKK